MPEKRAPPSSGVWPREEPRPAKSQGERAVWRALRAGLPADWYAWHSVRTGRDAIFTRERMGRHAFVGADHEEMEERLMADSFLRWKGLERPAIVVTDLPDGDLSQLGVRMYVALTRAPVCARLVGTREQQGRHGF